LACKYKYKYQYPKIVLKYRSSTSTSTQYNKTVGPTQTPESPDNYAVTDKCRLTKEYKD